MKSFAYPEYREVTTIADALASTAEKYPDKEALVFKSKRLTYAELYKKACFLSNLLRALGLSVGSKVGILLPRTPEYVQSYFAVAISGCVIVPIDVNLTLRETYSILNYCDVDLLITDVQRAALLGDLSLHCRGLRTVLLFRQGDQQVLKDQSNRTDATFPITYHIEEMAESTLEPISRASADSDSLALLLHTSGTISMPKRVMLSQRNVLTNAWSHIVSLGLRHEDRVLIALPMYFGYCNTAQMLAHILLGGTLVLLPGTFTPSKFCHLVETERITTFTAVPTMLFYLLEYRQLSKHDLSSLRYVCFGGSVMPHSRLLELTQALPSVGFVQTYGQTEAAPRITTLLPEDILRKPSSVGKAIPGLELGIFDEQELPCSPNKIGEVAVRGENVMLGYYKRPDSTSEVLHNGNLFTGDMGYLDDEGFLYLVGRKKNIIIRAGTNIYPEEIEEYLMRHPDVAEAAVIGEEHSLYGEIPIAFVVLRRGATISMGELVGYCKQGLAPYKIPARIEFSMELPKTYNQKLQRHKLRARLIGEGREEN